MSVTKGLIIAEPWIGRILSGEKTWEMRSQGTSYRGWFGLIAKGTGAVHGLARLVDVGEPMTPEEMLRTEALHRIPGAMIRSGYVAKWTVPWKLADIFRLPEPVPYHHKPGAVIWVEFDRDTQEALADAMLVMDLPSLLEKASSPRPEPVREMPRNQPALPVHHSHGSFLDRAARSERPAGAWTESPGVERLIGRSVLSAGNLRNSHFYLRDLVGAFPPDVIGGSNSRSGASGTVTIEWGGASPAVTDIDGTKRIFRSRGWIRAFFEKTGARVGDTVVIEQTGARSYRVRLERGDT
jgi:hypothetical protein